MSGWRSGLTSGGPSIYLIAGEESGDQLGGALMQALRRRDPTIRFSGIGGREMEAAGITSPFPIADIAVMGLTAVAARLPLILRRIRHAVDDVLAASPDILIVIDSPDFTHRVARRVRRHRPDIVIVNYVSPSVWVWRSRRAAKMAGYIDHVLAILPFEPEVHKRLGGPPCSYVGHPVIEKRRLLRPDAGERADLPPNGRPVLLILPGSRAVEVSRLLAPFGDAAGQVIDRLGPLDVIIPAVSHLEAEIRRECGSWPYPVEIVTGEENKFAAFRKAHAALAASGTATLELALAGVPMVAAYGLDWFLRLMRPVVGLFPKLFGVSSILLPNIILGENVVPEFIDKDATSDALARQLTPLLTESAERKRQVDAFARLDEIMMLDSDRPPSERAADVVLDVFHELRGSAG